MMSFFKSLILNRWIHFILLSFFLFGLSYFSQSNNDFRQRIEFAAFDSFNRLYPRQATEQIIIADIDEASLVAQGQWPWPRHVMADFVDRLNAMGARVIAFDMVFAEADRTSPARVTENWLGIDPDVSAKLADLPDHDGVFADAIARSGRVVTGFSVAHKDETLRNPAEKARFLIHKSARELMQGHGYKLPGVATNLPELSRVAAGNGAFISTPEGDGVIRRIPLILNYNDGQRDRLYPTLALEALRVAQNPKQVIKLGQASGDPGRLINAPLEVRVGPSVRIPMDKDASFYVHYRQMSGDDYISVADVFEAGKQEALRQRVEGKVVFVGTSAEGLKDIRSTPLDVFIPGVEVHANVLEQLIQGNYLLRPQLAIAAELSFIFWVGVVMIIMAQFIGALWMGLLCMALMIGACAGSFWLYMHQGILLEPIFPSIAVFLLFTASALLTYLRVEAERRNVRGAFGLYISPDFMKELTSNPDRLSLGGEIRDLTVMFTDIRNFTTISEAMTPETLINTMNDFLTPMSDVVMQTRGTIDKYMGDAMMAFWNAPLDDKNHARNACLAALKMQDVLVPVNEALQKQAEAEGRPFYELQAGIGVNTGPCSVGNMGSKQRFAYSALGDAVNLASRLEGQTKAYGLKLLIGEETAKAVDDFAVIEVDMLRVQGKTEPVRIYTLLGGVMVAQTEEFQILRERHHAMLAAYRKAAFGVALKELNLARQADSEGSLADLHMVFELRINAYKETPPPSDWDGVTQATSK